MSFLKQKTRVIRHSIAKVLTPEMYRVANPQTYRPFDSFLRHYFSKPLVGVEVGVWRGEHAKQLLESLTLERLFLVDSYLPFVEGNIVFKREEAERNLTITQLNVVGYAQTVFLKMLSVEASKRFENESLDFVYIDATHTYKGVTGDLEAWYGKTKRGGVIGGHDFSPDFQSVVKAVVDFSKQADAKLHFQSPDWWIIRGEKNEGIFS